MNKNNCVIRKEMPADYATVENLVRESFWNLCLVAWILSLENTLLPHATL